MRRSPAASILDLPRQGENACSQVGPQYSQESPPLPRLRSDSYARISRSNSGRKNALISARRPIAPPNRALETQRPPNLLARNRIHFTAPPTVTFSRAPHRIYESQTMTRYSDQIEGGLNGPCRSLVRISCTSTGGNHWRGARWGMPELLGPLRVGRRNSKGRPRSADRHKQRCRAIRIRSRLRRQTNRRHSASR